VVAVEALNEPAAQGEVVHEAEPAMEDLPAGQESQLAAPPAPTPKRMEMCPDQVATTMRTKRASTGALNVFVTFSSKFIEGVCAANTLPPSTSFQVEPSALNLTEYEVTRWFSQQLLFERAWVVTEETGRTRPKSTCAHWPALFDAADHACTESSMERAWPVPIASPDQTDEYERSDSGRLVGPVKVPAEQTEQVVLFVENLPGAQFSQNEALVLEIVPGAQAAQLAEPPASLAPKRMEICPDQEITITRR